MRKLKKILKKMDQKKEILWQFNFSTLEQLKGIIHGAKKFKKTFILGTSEGEADYLSFSLAVFLKKKAEKEIGVPLILNYDHAKSFEKIKSAIKAGYDMIHFDGSNLPLKENIKKTKEVVKFAKKYNVLVEGEVGFIPGRSKIEKVHFEKKFLTSPEEAKIFVKETKVDFFAGSFGSAHGISPEEHLDFERIKKIKKELKDVFLTLHGGSGIKNEEIKKARESGIFKINLNTELRKTFKNALKKAVFLESLKPYSFLQEAIFAVSKVVEKKFKII